MNDPPVNESSRSEPPLASDGAGALTALPEIEVTPDRRSTIAASSTPEPSSASGKRARAGHTDEAVEFPVVEGFEILGRLGAGGMGQVFKARAIDQDRVVALKVIRTDRSDEISVVQRFRREAKAGRRVNHPNIVSFYDDIRAGDVHYLTMEYVEGTDLAAFVEQSGKLPIDLACDCVRQAALGLQHAHERGLIHRDIKPANLVLSSDGTTVKILDMGLARLGPTAQAGETESALTHSGVMMGTLAYMAPEQAFDARNADGRADIYSLGCTLYHLLIGAPPHRHQMREPDPVHWSRSAVSPVLSAVIRRMMARLPEERYASAQDVAKALRPFCGERLSATPECAPEEPADRASQSSRMWLWCGVVTGGVAVFGILWLVFGVSR